MNYVVELLKEYTEESNMYTQDEYDKEVELVEEIIFYSVESKLNDLGKFVGFLEVVEDSYNKHIGDGNLSYESYSLYKYNCEAILYTLGVNIPVEVIVPSFESSDNNREYKEGVFRKIYEGIKRILTWFKERIKGVWEWATGKSKSNIEDAKQEVKEIERNDEHIREYLRLVESSIKLERDKFGVDSDPTIVKVDDTDLKKEDLVETKDELKKIEDEPITVPVTKTMDNVIVDADNKTSSDNTTTEKKLSVDKLKKSTKFLGSFLLKARDLSKSMISGKDVEAEAEKLNKLTGLLTGSGGKEDNKESLRSVAMEYLLEGDLKNTNALLELIKDTEALQRTLKDTQDSHRNVVENLEKSMKSGKLTDKDVAKYTRMMKQFRLVTNTLNNLVKATIQQSGLIKNISTKVKSVGKSKLAALGRRFFTRKPEQANQNTTNKGKQSKTSGNNKSTRRQNQSTSKHTVTAADVKKTTNGKKGHWSFGGIFGKSKKVVNVTV